MVMFWYENVVYKLSDVCMYLNSLWITSYVYIIIIMIVPAGANLVFEVLTINYKGGN